MKRVFTHPEPAENDLTGPKYWRSLDEVANTPGFQEYLEKEFPEGASSIEGVDRRHFIRIMAASFALGGVGMSGCRMPERHILPYSRQPERVIHGKPIFYASSMPLRRAAMPILVETHDGRPTKIEGNPSYAPNAGRTDVLAQASILDLYDPDRTTGHTRGENRLTPDELNVFLHEVGERFAANQGAGLAFLAETSGSPTRNQLVQALRQRFPQAAWAEYEPADEDAPSRAASQLLGTPVRPYYTFENATRILSLDSDLLQPTPGQLHHSRSFANGRRVEQAGDPMNRLYAVESLYTVTGGMADHRLRLATSDVSGFTRRLAARIFSEAGVEGELATQLTSGAGGSDEHDAWIAECAADLIEHQGQSLVVAGPHLPESVHALVFAINEALEARGSTVHYLATEEVEAESLGQLAERIRGGEVETLFVLGGNPVFNAPADFDWPDLQGQVGEVIRYGYYRDETSAAAGLHIAALHYLESWGTARAADGVVLPVQPMILPLFEGMSEIELLARLAGLETTDPYALAYQTVAAMRPDEDPERLFRGFLHDGLLADSGYSPAGETHSPEALQQIIGGDQQEAGDPFSATHLEVRFTRDNLVDDGRFINNGWLQECPDPITKLTWDNAILISPKLADEIGILPGKPFIAVARQANPNRIKMGRMIAPVAEVELAGRTVRAPLHIQPGLADYTIVLPLGYGRKQAGRIGQGVGFDFYRLRGSDAFHFAQGATLRVTGETVQLANAQEHWSMEGRAIIREGNKDYYDSNPGFVDGMGMESHTPPNFGHDRDLPLERKVTETPRGTSLYETPDFPGIHQWGMSIDLNTCIGCNACVVACQSENNIPIVGKDQVLRGREMHWMRIDRYYSTGAIENSENGDDPQVTLQPMLCQHCDNAPCEFVCPVNATVQDDEGLNIMAYNRCVGTRYCANNCPYKVRRFNFFDWNHQQEEHYYKGPLAPRGMEELHKMQKNPDVTVRMRGVMEKCTFCTQRIEAAKIDQKVKAGDSPDINIPDGAIQTACQQACPTESIMFGNLADTESEVYRWKHRDQDYSVLGYLNTRPRVTYLAKLRNPNPSMPDYLTQPLSTVEYYRKNYPNRDNNAGGGAEQ